MAKAVSNFINNNIFVLYWIAAIINWGILVFFYHAPLVETAIAVILFWLVGIMGCVSFFLHWYGPTADKIAEKIGWEPGSPFQKEVAAAGGAFGILGILSNWIHGNFWTATIIGVSFMYFMMGVGHIIDIKKSGNKAVYNAGSVLYSDILTPVVLMTLLVLWKLGY
ncbi:hypothetical protein KKH43_02935 [Patescibacteria group bacterium]|nr:hypothetical protein [Patescibacteria group bacterium]